MRIAVDAMGGDHAPGCVVQGAVEALALYDDIEIVLVGDQQRIEAELAQVKGSSDVRPSR